MIYICISLKFNKSVIYKKLEWEEAISNSPVYKCISNYPQHNIRSFILQQMSKMSRAAQWYGTTMTTEEVCLFPRLLSTGFFLSVLIAPNHTTTAETWICGLVLVTNYYLLTTHNWQKSKRVFLTCPCLKMYRDEVVGLKSCKYTWKTTIFVKMWNLGQYRENLIFCQ